jgi:Flp pilus assembly protein TadD
MVRHAVKAVAHFSHLLPEAMRRRRKQPNVVPLDESPEAALCRRAARFRRRGEHRRALVTLRLAAHTHEHNAKIWMLYGAQCARLGKDDAALEAFRHGAWVFEQRRQPAKAKVARQLADRVLCARAA